MTRGTRAVAKPRATTGAVPSRTPRYGARTPTATPRGAAVPGARTTPRAAPRVTSGPNPRLVPRSASNHVSSRVIPRASRGYGYRSHRGYYGRHGLGSVYSSWWNPCYSYGYSPSYWTLNAGYGCYGLGLSLWYPWYFATSIGWSSCYSSCWWNSTCRPYSYDYWWYPRSTYCPTYLYVPSSTVIYVEEAPASEPEPEEPGAAVVVEEAPAAGGAPAGDARSDLASKYVELGDFYFKAGRFQEAADAYARARTYAPDDAALHFVLADAAFAVGDYHFAAFLIAEGLRLDPGLASAEADKREFYGDRKLFDEHMKALDEHLEKNEYDASAHLVRGYNLRFSGEPEAAKAAFERVLELAPDHRAARNFIDAMAPKDAEKPVIR